MAECTQSQAKRILLICYKIAAGTGSEDGAGYHIARGLAERASHLTLVSRVNNIEQLRSDPRFADVELIGIDVPAWLRFYKKGPRGVILYYYIWQVLVGRQVRRLHATRRFDVIHQLNFHADWAPHFLPSQATRLIWGPIAHHRVVPASFLPHRSLRQLLWEAMKFVGKQTFWRVDPFLRRAARNSDVILYANRDLAPAFRRHMNKIRIRPYAGSFASPSWTSRTGCDFSVLSVGRLVPLKGFPATIEAFADFYRKVHEGERVFLTIVGSGQLEGSLRNLAERLAISHVTQFVAWMNQQALLRLYQKATVFVYPSFEAQGLVVAEAMASGLPVVCLAGTGPAELVGDSGMVIPRGTRAEVVDDLTRALLAIHDDFRTDARGGRYSLRSKAMQKRYLEYLDWPVIARDIADAYHALPSRIHSEEFRSRRSRKH